MINTIKAIKWLWRASKKLHLRIVLSAMLGILLVGLSLSFVYLSKELVDIATGNSDSDLTKTITLFVLTIIGQISLSTVISRIDSANFVKMKNSMRHTLFAKYIASNWNSSNPLHSGDITNRLDADVRVSSEAVCNYFPLFLSSVIQAGASFLFLLTLQPTLAWIILLVMPFIILVSRTFAKRLKRLTLNIRNTEGAVQSHIQESVQNYINIKTMEHSGTTVNSLGSLHKTLMRNEGSRINFSAFSSFMMQLGYMLGYAVAFLWGVMGLIEGSITFGVMTAFLQLVSQLQRPVADLTRQLPAFVRALASVERLNDIDSMPSEEVGDPIKLDGRVGLRFNGVDFSYPSSQRLILNGFSYNFAPGSITAILGETGVGKSTTIRLMLALLQPNGGEIDIYNSSESIAVCPSTRTNFVYVPQGNSLLSGTIRQNLLIANPNATNEDIERVLHIAVAEFVHTLPNGIDTECSERGGGLSEGQAQRIAIARALLRSGAVMLLDEPTSSLDAQTEELFIERLKLASADKTIIIITHRESILKLCSDVITLKKSY